MRTFQQRLATSEMASPLLSCNFCTYAVVSASSDHRNRFGSDRMRLSSGCLCSLDTLPAVSVLGNWMRRSRALKSPSAAALLLAWGWHFPLSKKRVRCDLLLASALHYKLPCCVAGHAAEPHDGSAQCRVLNRRKTPFTWVTDGFLDCYIHSCCDLGTRLGKVA